MSSLTNLIQAVRQRPGMYIGDTGTYGLHRLPLMLLQAGFNAAKEGRVDEVRLRLEASGACSCAFNGLLWPHPIEQFLTSQDEDFAIIHALSSSSELTVWSSGKAWRQSFQQGAPSGGVQSLMADAVEAPSSQGMRLRFMPDPAIFEQARLSRLGLGLRMQELAALQARVTYRLRDEVGDHEACYRFEQGLADLAVQLSESAAPLHAPWSFVGHQGTTEVRVAFQWCRQPGSRVLAWVNQLRTSGGTHLQGLSSGIHAALHHHAVGSGRGSDLPMYIPSVLLEGLTVLLAVTVPEPLWLGSLKEELANEECEFDISQLVQGWLRQSFERHPMVAEQVLEQVIARYVARG